MSTSIRKLAACLGIEGGFSIVEDFFGYRFGGHQRASLRTQARLLAGPHVNLNLIGVGWDWFSDKDKARIDGAVERMREIYGAAEIGVGRLRHFKIDEVDAIDSYVVAGVLQFDIAAKLLTNDWSVANGELDVFLVLHWSSDRPTKLGVSPIDGSCVKDGGYFESTGAVFALAGTKSKIGAVMAHEIGHYLGLDHIGGLDSEDVEKDEDGNVDPEFEQLEKNLMFPRVPNGGELEPWQRVLMKAHCFIRPGCPS